jgi:hypothetical protein
LFAMGSIWRVIAVVFLTAGCGGESKGSSGDETSNAGASSGGMTASAGSGSVGAGAIGNGGVPGSTSGGTAANGSATGGTAEVAQPADLGDGDHADDGRPAVPTDSTGGFFWRGCSQASWRLGNWWVTSDRQRDAFPREIDPPRDDSTEARGARGADFVAGVVLWVELDHPWTGSVSLSGCSGLSFWARLESPSGRLVVALNDGSRGSGLLDGRSSLPSRTLDVGPDWQEFVLPFESFPIQDAAADGLSLASIEFFVGDGGEDFDLWVDDLALVCSEDCR